MSPWSSVMGLLHSQSHRKLESDDLLRGLTLLCHVSLWFWEENILKFQNKQIYWHLQAKNKGISEDRGQVNLCTMVFIRQRQRKQRNKRQVLSYSYKTLKEWEGRREWEEIS